MYFKLDSDVYVSRRELKSMALTKIILVSLVLKVKFLDLLRTNKGNVHVLLLTSIRDTLLNVCSL